MGRWVVSGGSLCHHDRSEEASYELRVAWHVHKPQRRMLIDAEALIRLQRRSIQDYASVSSLSLSSTFPPIVSDFFGATPRSKMVPLMGTI